jgi:hypothetical protein
MKRFFIFFGIIAIIVVAVTLIISRSSHSDRLAGAASEALQDTAPQDPPKPVITHLATPTPVKAVYVSSWVAASPTPYKHVMDLVEKSEVNAIVLDIKDATGRVSFLTDDPTVSGTGSPENRIKDIVGLIRSLHEKNIYVIGRISTFQDPYLTKVKPEWALTKKSDGTVWKDRKGLSFLDVANKNVWDYTVALANASYNVGFDEINFDYVRYPSDGNVKDINYKLVTKADGTTTTRAENVEAFFKYLNEQVRIANPAIKTSADLFGLTTTEKTDMGIGQVLEKALPHFDYIAPMIYPSHYAKGEYGLANPATKPYETITKALAGAKNKIDAMQADPNLPPEIKAKVSYSKIRPWLQDFSINSVTYTADMIKAQMKATYDAGLDSWMMWDPSNKYTTAAYQTDLPSAQ